MEKKIFGVSGLLSIKFVRLYVHYLDKKALFAKKTSMELT